MSNQPGARADRVRVERGIYRRASGRYAVCVMIDGKPRLRTVTAITVAEAREQRELVAAAARRGELPAFRRLTFAEAAARWLQLYERRVAIGERRERTLENYRYHLQRHLLPMLGRRRLQAITPDMLAQLIASLQAERFAPKTIAGALVPLGSILRFGLRHGYIRDNPLRKLEQTERPHSSRREQRVLSRDQIRRLLGASPPRYLPLLATATFTGMRLSELLGLTWEDVDFAVGTVHVRSQLSRARIGQPARRIPPKTAAAVRAIPLAPQLAVMLHRHKRRTRFARSRDYVFATGCGTPLAHRNANQRALTRAAERAGLNEEGEPRLRFHDLRHTFASHLIIDLRLDVAHVSRILGHASTSITLDTYTHLFAENAHGAELRARIARSEFANLLRSFISPSTGAKASRRGAAPALRRFANRSVRPPRTCVTPRRS
jgi:integrase